MRHIFSNIPEDRGQELRRWKDRLNEAVKTERSHKLIQLGKEKKQKYMKSFLGQQVEILFEETAKIQGEEYLDRLYKGILKVAAKAKKIWKIVLFWEKWKDLLKKVFLFAQYNS